MAGSGPEELFHFVSVWNPQYALDAMDVHLGVLLSAIKEDRRQPGEAERNDSGVYVWWGKLRSADGQHPLPHAEALARAASVVRRAVAESHEVHLYLTDYRSLYVGDVRELTLEDVRDQDGPRVPKYVRARASKPPGSAGSKSALPPYKRAADCWFKLADIRRLVADDTTAVAAEVERLRNVGDGGRRVSLYGGMRDLPLVVTRDDHARLFAPDERDDRRGRRWWAEIDRARGKGIGAIERDLRDNVLGDEVWAGLDLAARGFVATGKKTFREHRTDPSFDFSWVVINFGKAVEVQVRHLVLEALQDAPREARIVMSARGNPKDLADSRTVTTLGEIEHLMGANAAFTEALTRLAGGSWLTGEFRHFLARFAPDARNPAAHDSRISLDKATAWRNEFLGVGRAGVLEQLARVRPIDPPRGRGARQAQ